MNIDLTKEQYLDLIKLIDFGSTMLTSPPELSERISALESYILSFYKDFELQESDIVKSKIGWKLSYKFLEKHNMHEIIEVNTTELMYFKLATIFASREFEEKYKDKPLREKDIDKLGKLLQKYITEFEENGFDNLKLIESTSNVISITKEAPIQKKIDESGEFIDTEHFIEPQYDEFMDNLPDNMEKAIKRLKYFIQKDPYFFEPYLSLYELYYQNNMRKKAQEILDQGYKKAVEYIKDEKGNLPKKLRWGFLTNRHIIRILHNKALVLWNQRKTNESLELLRTILKLNPLDNSGVRYYILAIRMNMTFAEFQKRFDKDGFYDSSIDEWFDSNYKSFPDEFDWWEKETQE